MPLIRLGGWFCVIFSLCSQCCCFNTFRFVFSPVMDEDETNHCMTGHPCAHVIYLSSTPAVRTCLMRDSIRNMGNFLPAYTTSHFTVWSLYSLISNYLFCSIVFRKSLARSQNTGGASCHVWSTLEAPRPVEWRACFAREPRLTDGSAVCTIDKVASPCFELCCTYTQQTCSESVKLCKCRPCKQ